MELVEGVPEVNLPAGEVWSALQERPDAKHELLYGRCDADRHLVRSEVVCEVRCVYLDEEPAAEAALDAPYRNRACGGRSRAVPLWLEERH